MLQEKYDTMKNDLSFLKKKREEYEDKLQSAIWKMIL